MTDTDRPDGPQPAGTPVLRAPAGARPAVPPAEIVRRPRPGAGGPLPGVLGAASAVVRRPRPSLEPPALVRAAPNLARVAAASAWQAFSWSVGATIAGANYVAQRAVEGEAPTAILHEAAHDLRSFAWRALGINDAMAATRPKPYRGAVTEASPEDLQRQGTDLLRQSNDVHVVEDTHPAFARILTEITPDEARILRYLYLDGPQPAIDVRTYRPFGIGSVLVATGLNMIAEHAGCRNVDRINPYLTNLSRLGLVHFSAEPVSNPQRYQVVEAQPKVTDALKRAGRMPRTVHRSFFLTEFGAEFVRTCLPLNERAVPSGQRPQIRSAER